MNTPDFPNDVQEREQQDYCIRCGQLLVKPADRPWGGECPDDSKHTEGVIPEAQLEHGVYYWGWGRNGLLGRWDAEKHIFWCVRSKFRYVYTENVPYIPVSPGWGFAPLCKATTLPWEFPMGPAGWDPPEE